MRLVTSQGVPPQGFFLSGSPHIFSQFFISVKYLARVIFFILFSDAIDNELLYVTTFFEQAGVGTLKLKDRLL